jgi:hypothetical protein
LLNISSSFEDGISYFGNHSLSVLPYDSNLDQGFVMVLWLVQYYDNINTGLNIILMLISRLFYNLQSTLLLGCN